MFKEISLWAGVDFKGINKVQEQPSEVKKWKEKIHETFDTLIYV